MTSRLRGPDVVAAAALPLLAALLAATAALAAAQDTPVKGLRISLAPKAAPVQRVTLENRRDSALVAFQVGLFVPGATAPSRIYFADYTFDGALASTGGAIGARQRKSIDIDVRDEPEVASAVVMLAQFADGHCEGHPPAEDSGHRLRMPCPKPSGPVTSVGVSAERTSRTAPIILVENLTGVPIEAFGFEIVRPAPAGALAQTIDYCTAPADTPPPHGRLQPRETRELPIAASDAAAAAAGLTATFVLFDDRSFEGRVKEREELFRKRESQAEGYAFAVAALRDATALPVDEAIALLERRRSQRSRELRGEGRRDDVYLLYDAIEEGKRAPQTFAAFLKGFIELVEEQRQQLLRHRRTTQGSPL